MKIYSILPLLFSLSTLIISIIALVCAWRARSKINKKIKSIQSIVIDASKAMKKVEDKAEQFSKSVSLLSDEFTTLQSITEQEIVKSKRNELMF